MEVERVQKKLQFPGIQVQFLCEVLPRQLAWGFKNTKIAIPPTKSEQIAIATVLSDIDTEIEALEQKLTKYKRIKIGMMQNLLTGKIRVYEKQK